MKYVLDASVAIKWVLTELDSARALALRNDYRKQLHGLLPRRRITTSRFGGTMGRRLSPQRLC